MPRAQPPLAPFPGGGVAHGAPARTAVPDRPSEPWTSRPIQIAPSLLSADFARLAEELASVEEAGADWHHVDVMDGHFVPNLTIGPVVVEHIHARARRPLDVHLMISEPLRYAEAFARAGARILTFHVEVCPDDAAVRAMAAGFRARGVPEVGVALNPDTPVERVAGVLDAVDLVLVMSVFPGFGGQRFRPEVLPKVAWLRSHGYAGRVEMDGGLNPDTLAACARAGADMLVAGSAIYGVANRRARIAELRAAAEGARRAPERAL